METVIGQTLNNRYTILRMLGTGGMGTVYCAHDPVLDRDVAIKQLQNDPITGQSAAGQIRTQFQREARILASLHHPNLPRVTDYFTDNQRYFLVMDYIEGQTLQELVQATPGGLKEAQVLDWADQLLAALEYIHAHQLIHRDVKPANIRLTPDGRIFLVDFGLARPNTPNYPRTMTMIHGVGTPEYSPPEQYDPEAHTDQRSDIYALGATLYHLLTGQAPVSATRRTADPESFRTLQQVKTNIAPDVESVILRAMEIERAKRFPSAADMRAALYLIRQARAVDPGHTTILPFGVLAPVKSVPRSMPMPVSQKRHRRRLLLIGVLAALMSGALLGLAIQPTGVVPALTATLTATPTITTTETLTATLSGMETITPVATIAVLATATPGSQNQVQPGPAPPPVQATPAGKPTPKPKITPPGQVKPKNTPASGKP